MAILIAQENMIDLTEYSNRYNEIMDLLISGYYDALMLQTIDEIRPESKNYAGASFMALVHVSELLKRDLALTIWRIYVDSDPKANTIKHLNDFLRRNGVETQQKLTLSNRALKEKLERVRNSFLAHNDVKKSDVTIDISDLYIALDEIRLMLNGLCFPNIDPKVTQLTDQMNNNLSFDAKIGLGLLLQGYSGKRE